MIGKPNKAVILAGGSGTRMGELSRKIPKAMFRIDGVPLLEHQLKFLKKYGIHNVILCTGYLSNIIETYLEDVAYLGMSIKYSIESKPLGTAGCLKEIEYAIDDTFLVIYGDIVFDIDLKRFVNFHVENKSSLTLFTHPNDHPYDSDLVETGNKGRIVRFHPKPHPLGEYFPNNANAAIYLVEPIIFEHIRKGIKADLAGEVFPRLLNTNLALYAYRSPEYVKDVGTPERLDKVSRDFASGKV